MTLAAHIYLLLPILITFNDFSNLTFYVTYTSCIHNMFLNWSGHCVNSHDEAAVLLELFFMSHSSYFHHILVVFSPYSHNILVITYGDVDIAAITWSRLKTSGNRKDHIETLFVCSDLILLECSFISECRLVRSYNTI